LIIAPDRELLERFYREVYLPAFATQREPIDAWHAALAGERGYALTIRVALEGSEIRGGIAYELYPRSRCGLVTYMVVAPSARRSGLGRELQMAATRELRDRGALAVFGEVNDPRSSHDGESADEAWTRLERNQRWGARVVDVRYVQPDLGHGRDRGLLLIALDEQRRELPGELVRGFVAELFEANEGGPPDAELRAVLDAMPYSITTSLIGRTPSPAG
jgi:GNAT superfamily N-acetyltransferase